MSNFGNLYRFFVVTSVINPETQVETEVILKESVSFKNITEMENYVKGLKTYNDRQMRLFKDGHIPAPKFRKLITN